MSKHKLAQAPCTEPCAECRQQLTCFFSSRYKHYEAPRQSTNSTQAIPRQGQSHTQAQEGTQ